MKTKNNLFIISATAILTIGILSFVYYSNDHKECQSIIKSSKGENGEQISIEKHICKEMFNI